MERRENHNSEMKELCLPRCYMLRLDKMLCRYSLFFYRKQID